MDDFDDFETEVERLEARLGAAASVAASFETELARVQDGMLFTGREAAGLSRRIGNGFRRAFDGLVFDGMRLSDALGTVVQSVLDGAYNAAIRPVQGAVGGAVTNGINALFGNVAAFGAGGGRVTPFARGGVVRGPTTFPMQGGTGLVGEAGPEAILPLRRGPDGALGVAAGAAPTQHVTVNISTPDVAGFRRSQSQVAAQLTRALSRGGRNR